MGIFEHANANLSFERKRRHIYMCRAPGPDGPPPPGHPGFRRNLSFPFNGLARRLGEPVVRFYDVPGSSSEPLLAQNRHRSRVLARMSYVLRFCLFF